MANPGNSQAPMAQSRKVLYLIGQFPAINHKYLLTEIRQLRNLGFDISVARSVSQTAQSRR